MSQREIFRAKKSLGQNFLKSKKILGDIVAAGELSAEDTVLEIGPGKGALTEMLLEKAGKVIAIETDYALFDMLQNKFAEEIKIGKLELARQNVLDLNPQTLGKYKIIANIPYNITGAILEKFLTAENQPSIMVLLVQKEVAQRIVADKSSLLSISVSIYGQPKIIGRVSKRFFSPSPKVDSAIIRISNISRENFSKNGIAEENFWKIVHAGFKHKRKKLENNLKNIIPADLLIKLGLKGKRAEDLSPKDWLLLAKL